MPFIGRDFGLRAVEDALRHDAVLFRDKQFRLAQTCRDAEARIVFERVISPNGFVGLIERPQHFGSTKCGNSLLRHAVVIRNLTIQLERFTIPIQSRQRLSAEKFPACRVAQRRLFQQMERLGRAPRRNQGLCQFFLRLDRICSAESANQFL